MTKNELLREIRLARADLLDAIDGLTAEQVRQAGAVGIWSVKDVLAHLTVWESELVTALNQAHPKRIPSLVLIDDLHTWNQEQYHIHVKRPLDLIWDDFMGVHEMLVQMVEGYKDKHLFDNRVFEWMEGEPLAYLIQETAIWHEREHAEDIRRWREINGL